MIFEEPKNYYVDKTVGKWTVICKEDNEREHFGSGGGKVIWRKGDDVKKEVDNIKQKEKDAKDKNGKDGAEDKSGWNTGADSSWDAERSAWENS